MQEMKLAVPTYFAYPSRDGVLTPSRPAVPTSSAAMPYSGRRDTAPQSARRPDFGPPYVAVVVHEAEGVRVVLGTHDRHSGEYPDIQIERRANGWAIFLHPVGGCDPSGYVYFLDDGRSFIEMERQLGPTPVLQVHRRGAPLRDLDRLG